RTTGRTLPGDAVEKNETPAIGPDCRRLHRRKRIEPIERQHDGTRPGTARVLRDADEHLAFRRLDELLHALVEIADERIFAHVLVVEVGEQNVLVQVVYRCELIQTAGLAIHTDPRRANIVTRAILVFVRDLPGSAAIFGAHRHSTPAARTSDQS